MNLEWRSTTNERRFLVGPGPVCRPGAGKGSPEMLSMGTGEKKMMREFTASVDFTDSDRFWEGQ